MVVQEREDFRGKVVPLEEWKIKLQQDFPFMEQDPNDDGHNIYRKWGFECYGGWYRLLRECCEAIVKRYEKDGIGIDDIDFVPAQIKEKFGTLRLYYGYVDAPCGIAAIDNLATGESIRLEPKSEGEINNAKAKLRQDIRAIVHAAEQKSKNTCEVCGSEGELRNDSDVGIHRVKTLCDTCHENRIRNAIEAKKNREQKLEEILEGEKSGE